MENKQPWDILPHVWKTQSAFYSWVRGGLRLGLWNTSPLKLEFIKSKAVKIKNTNEKSMKRFPLVNAWECECCGNYFKSNEINVDHKDGNNSLKSIDDLLSFFMNIVMVKFEELRILCKPCHKIITHANKKGISFEEAKAEKMTIQIIKDKEDKVWLMARGISPASNQKARREQIINKILEKENK